MRTAILLSGSALALLLGTGPAGALSHGTRADLSPERACLVSKLQATTRYHRCVTHAYGKAGMRGGEPSDEQIARCDHRLERAFELVSCFTS